MDDEPTPEHHIASQRTVNVAHGAPYAGAFFPRSRNFTIAGSVFTSNVTIQKSVLDPPSDFRRIPWGDIDLRDIIRVDPESGVAQRQNHRGCMRRMYSARIEGRKSEVAVAVYQGENAEEEWKKDITKYSSLRHANLMQLYVAASSSGVHAAVFNDDLIPYEQFLDRYRGFHFLTVYIHAHCDTEFKDVHRYLSSLFAKSLFPDDCTLWIRRSTGRLCADPGEVFVKFRGPYSPLTLDGLLSLGSLGPDSESTVISSLTLEQYNHACYWKLARLQPLIVARDTVVDLGLLMLCPSNTQPEYRIATMMNPEVDRHDWAGAEGVKMAAGWTRYNSSDVSNENIHCAWGVSCPESWISQANVILKPLQGDSDYENYVLVDRVVFALVISGKQQPAPPGYLFLCPTANLRCGPSSFRWPDYPAYWSLDPLGAEGLSPEEAAHRGFPSIELHTRANTKSWDNGVYLGIRQFYKAKGFDPDSQDVARHLGHPLWELSVDVGILFANVDDDKFDSTEESFNCEEKTSDDECPPETQSNIRKNEPTTPEETVEISSASGILSPWNMDMVDLVKLVLMLMSCLALVLEYV